MIAATLGLFNTANAEGMDPAALKNVYDITRNTSGLMSYCVDKGFLKADSIDNAKKMVAYVAAIPAVSTPAMATSVKRWAVKAMC